jgi:hypothetical protein
MDQSKKNNGYQHNMNKNVVELGQAVLPIDWQWILTAALLSDRF